jgi:hypothetical protein
MHDELVSIELPPCAFREIVGARIFCGHCRVHAPPENFVSPGLCRICQERTMPCDEPRRPAPAEMPSLPTRAKNFAWAAAAFVADGMRTVTEEQYHARLTVCDTCPERSGNRCLKCGCNLSFKARGRAFHCPLHLWPDDSPPQAPAITT